MYSFEFESPTTVADAVAALGKEEAQALAGGQTLIPSLKARLAAMRLPLVPTTHPEKAPVPPPFGASASHPPPPYPSTFSFI